MLYELGLAGIDEESLCGPSAVGAESSPLPDLGARLASLSARVRLAASPHSGGGRALVTARRFAAGETIFVEPAIVCVTSHAAVALRMRAAVARKRDADARRARRAAPAREAAPVREAAPDGLDLFVPGCGVLAAQGLDAAALGAALAPLHPAEAPPGGAHGAPRALSAARLEAVLRSNGAEVLIGGAPSPLTAVFLALSMMNCACAPAAAYESDWLPAAGAPRARVFAQRDLEEGEELTLAYARPQQPRAARRAELLDGWGFECACARCAAGEDARALRCAACGRGAVAVPVDDAELAAARCGQCGAAPPAAARAAALQSARADALFWLENAEGDAARARGALALLHKSDGGLRAALGAAVAEWIDAQCAGAGAGAGAGALPPALVLEMARAARAGAEASAYLPLGLRRASAPLLEADAACAAAARLRSAREAAGDGDGAGGAGGAGEAPALEAERAALEAAAAAYGTAAAAFETALAGSPGAAAWAALLRGAAAAPPATAAALRELREARSELARGEDAAAWARVGAGARAQLWR